MEPFKSEAQLQAACVAWFWNSYPQFRGRLFAVQNNSENVVRGSNRKAMGVMTGVSDLVLIHRGKTYFIELKNGFGKTQSPEQIKFEKMVHNEGFDYFVIHSLDRFYNLINRIING